MGLSALLVDEAYLRQLPLFLPSEGNSQPPLDEVQLKGSRIRFLQLFDLANSVALCDEILKLYLLGEEGQGQGLEGFHFCSSCRAESCQFLSTTSF